MRLLRYDDRGELSLTRDLSDKQIPDYAILSHTWGDEQDEITFHELENGLDKSKTGYKKLQLCGEQAKRDGLDYFWVDTCCINKSHGPELSENINLMFRYYQKSKRCYVYLADVLDRGVEEEFRKSKWFTRGWTLQELLAPNSVDFFSSAWDHLGSKAELEQTIHDVTQIPRDALRGIDLSEFSRHERMCWIQGRETKKEEDRAYSLLGVFGVSMVVNYGEGEAEAFCRLEDQIKRKARPTLQNIDDCIRKYYLSDGRLDIVRLSDQRLSMDTCFINLAVINRPHDSNGWNESIHQETNAFTLAARLKVKTPQQSEAVTLEALFQPRKLLHGTTSRPKRVVIWGRAGMGKTTLCKKIIHDFLNKGLWNHLYDRVFWLPLRRLKLTQSKTKSVTELIREICFHGANDDLLLTDTFDDIVRDSGDRCLFILDGLDEVSHIDRDSPMGANLYKLLKQVNVIITSRPHGSSVLNEVLPDLEFETVGFFPEQVEEFLCRETEQESIPAIRSFIQCRPVVQSLVRIPIQLDAICYAWDQEQFHQDKMTMTLLYQDITLRLWQKDIVRLGKKFHGDCVTLQQIRSSRNVEYFVKSESSCLEELAFAGLYNQLAEFNAGNINAIAGGQEPLLDSRLCELSFLRSSERFSKSTYQTHHFIHLTFQEFFAARYFVRYWLSSEPMVFPKMPSSTTQFLKDTEKIMPVDLIRRHKYSTHYNIFWRFVTGLLQIRGGTEALDQFFRQLESEPCDLIGLAHQLLLIHCLHEVLDDGNCFHEKKQRLEREYRTWTLFVSNLCQSRKLLAIAECPNSIFKHWLGASNTEKAQAIQVLVGRSSVSFENVLAIVIIAKNVQETTDQDLLHHALAFIAVHCDRLSEEEVSGLFAAHSIHEWSMACSFIPYGQVMGQCVLERVVQLLQDHDTEIRCSAINTLSCQSNLPISVLETLVQSLQDRGPKVRSCAANALSRQSNIPAFAVEALVRSLQDQEPGVRSCAANALSRQSSIPAFAVEALVLSLQDRGPKVRCFAARALSCQSNIPVFAVEALIRSLRDHEPNVRSSATFALSRQSGLPESAIEALVRNLEDYDSEIRQSTARALSCGSALSVSALEALIQGLQHPRPHVRSSAALVLLRQSDLPASAVDALILKLEDYDADIQRSATEALLFRTSSSVPAVATLVRLLSDQKFNYPHQAVARLLGAPVIPKYYLNVLICLLKTIETARYAAQVLVPRAEFYESFAALDPISLQNLLRYWLEQCVTEDEYLYAVFYDNVLMVEIDGKQLRVPFTDDEREIFEQRWICTQRAVGVPKSSIVTRSGQTSLKPRKRKRR